MIRVPGKSHMRIFLFLMLTATAACAGEAPVPTGAAASPAVAQPSPDSPGTATVPGIPPQSFLNNLVGMDLVDQHGRPFQATGLIDQVVLFNFIFTNCGSVCPMQTRILAQVLGDLPADVRDGVRFVSLSIDPGNDTPAKLSQFAKAMDADREGWSFLTGDARQIEQLAERLRLFDIGAGPESKPEMHRASLWLVDGQGRMLQRYRGDPPDKERLVRELTQVSHMTIR